MGKRAFKIKTLPKYWRGGYMDGLEEQAPAKKGMDMNMLGSMMNMGANAADSALDDENEDFMAKYGQDKAKADKMADTGIAAISAIPGWGTVIGAGLKAGQAVGKASQDEYGIYKSKSGEFFDKSFNPTEGIGGLKRMFDEPTFDNVANQLSLGLVGKNTRQEELKHAKKVFEFDKTTRQAAQNAQAGAMMKNSLPVYQAPAYGKDGLKLGAGKRFSSKFSNFK